MNDLNGLNLSAEIKNRIQQWISDEYDPLTRNEIIQLIEKKDEKELTDRFYTDLQFGTGGLRGIIGAGTNRMNKYNIWKATQGLCNYLIKQYEKGIKGVIAYDCRNFSYAFAKETALVMAGNNIKVYLFESLRPTPILSFAVRHLKAHTGVVITASHNPPEYNGYKAYWQDGGQIVPPHDKNIINHVKEISSLKQVKHLPEKEAKKKGLLNIIGKEVDKAYYKKVLSLSINRDIVKKVAGDIKIVYTPIHGSGNVPVRRALANLGLKKVFIVKKQEKPDGNFPTVKSPNPEDPAALAMGIDLCKSVDADILIGTDPDSDRIGVVVKNSSNNYTILNGNQIASLLTYYVLSQLKRKNRLPQNGMIISTIVTTDLLEKIADDFNIQTKKILTGFKYIGEQIRINETLMKQKKPFKQYIIGGEESYGMLIGDFVRDKDAVSASALFAEMAGFLKYNNSSIMECLDEIYKKYGYYKEDLRTITLKGIEGIEKIKKIMDTFRNNPLPEICNLKLLKTGDVQKGILLNLANNKVELKYDLPVSNVLILFLENNIKISMRPSGTEPKIKFYFAGCGLRAADLVKTKQEVDARLKTVIDKFLELVGQIGV